MNFPGSFRVKVTCPDLPVSWATSLLHMGSPEKTVVFLNKRAADMGINATYEVATEEEYWAYRQQLDARRKTVNGK